MHDEMYLHCPDCAQVRPAEAPPCPDGHGAECPERVCTVCGAALLVGASFATGRAARLAVHRAA